MPGEGKRTTSMKHSPAATPLPGLGRTTASRRQAQEDGTAHGSKTPYNPPSKGFADQTPSPTHSQDEPSRWSHGADGNP